MGYEVALAEPMTDFYFYRNPFPHDLILLKIIRSWLGSDGLVYCGHNVLYWTPFLRALGMIRCRVVSNIWAREPLNLSRAHSGIIALTPAGAEQAKKLAPKVKVAHLGWGCDLGVLPRFQYRPESFLSCGITHRDHHTLSLAAARSRQSIRVIIPGESTGVNWPPNVQVIDGGSGWNVHDKKVTFQDLLHDHYAQSAGSLIIIKKDPSEYTAVGCTQLLEAMAMARPVIVTRTGALPGEIDVEKAGCGLHVPPEDPDALAEAMEFLATDPRRAQAMGEKGRQLAETHYNIQRFANDLHKFFETL